MYLNDYRQFGSIDRENMYGEIEGLPKQLLESWRMGLGYPMPALSDVKNIVIAGMGGSAIGADLLVSYVSRLCKVPMLVQREYWLPKWAMSDSTLVIASSHSGNTEETLTVFEQAKAYGAQRWVISTGGALADLSKKDGVPFWPFSHKGQPRAAVGYSFGLLLALLYRLGMIPDQGDALQYTVNKLHEQLAGWTAEIPVENNLAKKLALSMHEKWVFIMGSDYLAPVARRWKGQINELAKAWAQFEFLPEADHNTLAGTSFPGIMKTGMKSYLLRTTVDHPRNQLRASLTAQAMREQQLEVQIVDIEAENPLTSIWSALLLGDYAAYYLAMLYEVDPTPITIMQDLKTAMKNN